MKLQVFAATLGVVAITLGACTAPEKLGGNTKICADFKVAKAAPGTPGAEGAGAVDDCLKRWAYSLAPSRDDAGIVAEAARAACGGPLSAWNQQIVSQGVEGESASLMTGEPTTPIAEHNAYAARRGLFYVVQARAGSCPAPAAKDGVPEGI